MANLSISTDRGIHKEEYRCEFRIDISRLASTGKQETWGKGMREKASRVW